MRDINKLRASQRRWWAKHAERENAVRAKKRKKMVTWYAAYKKQFSCVRCGESHPACLHFHHLNPEEKRIEVARMAKTNYSKKAILDEMDKCVVLCANCHRKEHYGN